MNWSDFICEQQALPYLAETLAYVEERRAQGVTVFPPQEQVFSAFESTPFDRVSVVLLGQDPYHGENQAHGLCFSVLPGIKPPPSLVNMYKELATDVAGFRIPDHGYLQKWAQQGVLMLNTVLTVEQGLAHSHKHLGWEQFTDAVINVLNERKEPIIFVLWGAHAQKKGKKINRARHTVIAGPHPSPLSAYRGFFGCQHFSKINAQLISQGQDPIDWQV
ncbi:uracil-DNA glycosylase [Pseudoalteromonas ulvae UL12]|uniref:Uracil-DNA glycosylase n=1 Tax=Pseudoalteromonas ulvae TaxID=107327 RepID=A0A244CUB1_PSEDV|nr:uracil-DNA glycosylase [Pseudoalteromonas ulvae]MBE0362845.1 uracil-DNA glycosylase [Pseudoalteromonas ulvae UL12]OUL59181.1 uracil-DNA glycosylase [Pseudoalteromonas ulvae]